MTSEIQKQEAKLREEEPQRKGPPLAPSPGHVTGMEEAFDHLKRHRAEARRRRDEGRRAIAEIILSQAYALVGDTFDPARTYEVHALLDRLKELGAVVYDRRDVERWRVERAEAEAAAPQQRKSDDHI